VHIFLWALQIALAAKFMSAGITHALHPDATKTAKGRLRFGRATRPLLTLTGLCAWVVAAGLILPGATGLWSQLTPWAAAFLALMNLLAIGFHLTCRESPKIWVSLILFALAALVAYGRWVVAPF
jgi:hypothetical protein